MRVWPLLLVAVFGISCAAAFRESAIKDLRSSDHKKRAAAVDFLTKYDGAKKLPEIMDVLKDDLPEIKISAAECLAAIKDPRAIPALVETAHEKDEDVREAAVSAIAAFGDAGVSTLLDLLDRSHPESLRARAAWTLGMSHAPRAFDPLVALLKKKSAPDMVRAAAARALGCIENLEAYKPLYDAAYDDANGSDVRCGAIVGLITVSVIKGETREVMDLMSRLKAAPPSPQVGMCAAGAHSELYEPSGLGRYCNPEGFRP